MYNTKVWAEEAAIEVPGMGQMVPFDTVMTLLIKARKEGRGHNVTGKVGRPTVSPRKKVANTTRKGSKKGKC